MDAIKKMKRAFTLIELSIVLVIIGLIAGGVLVGRDLIESSKVRSALTQYDRFNAAVNTFRGKYSAMPGDMTQGEGITFNFAPTSRPSITNVTHGNQLLESGNTIYADATKLASENLLFWRDLSSAKLIENNFTLATDAAPSPFLTTTSISNYLPASSLDAYWVAQGNNYYDNLAGRYPLVGQNYFFLGGIRNTTDSSGETTFYSAFSGKVAYNIDAKIDDGLPFSGAVTAADFGMANGLDSFSGCGVTAQYSPTGKITYRVFDNIARCNIAMRLK